MHGTHKVGILYIRVAGSNGHPYVCTPAVGTTETGGNGARAPLRQLYPTSLTITTPPYKKNLPCQTQIPTATRRFSPPRIAWHCAPGEVVVLPVYHTITSVWYKLVVRAPLLRFFHAPIPTRLLCVGCSYKKCSINITPVWSMQHFSSNLHP